MADHKFVLIDGNAIGYAQQLGMTKLSTGDQPTHAIYGFLGALRKLVIPDPSIRIPIVLWDGNASWRKEILPTYKANRKDDPKKLKLKAEYESQIGYLKELLLRLGVDQIYSPTAEADDLAGAYSRWLAGKGHHVELVTGDQDWLQLVEPRVVWNDPIRDRRVDITTFEDFTDYPNPRQFLAAKCLMGDTSDNIKGVGGIGKVGAKKLLDRYGSIKAFLSSEFDNSWPKAWQRLHENTEPYRRNLELMRLDGKGVDDKRVVKGQFSRDAFRTACEELNFMSITGNLDNWIAPFQRLRK